MELSPGIRTYTTGFTERLPFSFLLPSLAELVEWRKVDTRRHALWRRDTGKVVLELLFILTVIRSAGLA